MNIFLGFICFAVLYASTNAISCFNGGKPQKDQRGFEFCNCKPNSYGALCEFVVEEPSRKLLFTSPLVSNIRLNLCQLFGGEIRKFLECDLAFSPGATLSQLKFSNAFDMPTTKTMALVASKSVDLPSAVTCLNIVKANALAKNFVCNGVMS
uniref:EGF-like domain-containing protein n=1 Tax=Panagrolaimus davidi TaxID=227884 RepID=A0A914QJC0_9BILA